MIETLLRGILRRSFWRRIVSGYEIRPEERAIM
jgi:hypothetical protein